MSPNSIVVPLLIGVREVAHMFAIAPQTLRLLACRGRLPFPAFKIGGRLKFRRADVETSLEAQRIAAIEEPFNLEAARNAFTFADPRDLFEWALWKYINTKDVAQLDVAIQSFSLLADEYQKIISVHEENSARGKSQPECIYHSSERQRAHSAILKEADAEWAQHQPEMPGARKQWEEIWNSVFDNSMGWIDTNNIVLLKVLLEHLLEMVRGAQQCINRQSVKGECKDQKH